MALCACIIQTPLVFIGALTTDAGSGFSAHIAWNDGRGISGKHLDRSPLYIHLLLCNHLHGQFDHEPKLLDGHAEETLTQDCHIGADKHSLRCWLRNVFTGSCASFEHVSTSPLPAIPRRASFFLPFVCASETGRYNSEPGWVSLYTHTLLLGTEGLVV
jgi:hypothetical protein